MLASQVPGVLFSLLVTLFTLAAWWLVTFAPAAYYQIVQEDGPLEWATFWGFALAAGVWLRVWLQGGQRNVWLNVYLLGLGAGCLLLALEEISWGQRLFAFQPPEVFLRSNYQQEANLHNFADAGLRKAALLALLLGYGVLFPLLARQGVLRCWFKQRHLRPPALSVAPGFAGAAALYLVYPWHNTGEWVELYAGFGFLACAALEGNERRLFRIAPLFGLTLFAGLVTPWLVPEPGAAERVLLAQQETRALATDFQRKRLRSRCGVHMRVYSFIESHGARRMRESDFGKDFEDPDDLRRRANFLDPWQLPYWIRHSCEDGESIAFVYSFGADRRRQSTASRIAGDDVGAYVTDQQRRTRR